MKRKGLAASLRERVLTDQDQELRKQLERPFNPPIAWEITAETLIGTLTLQVAADLKGLSVEAAKRDIALVMHQASHLPRETIQ